MINSEIASLFDELADLLEIAGENHFKVRAYRNASETIRGLTGSLKEIPPAEIAELPGIGKAISGKIESALASGTFPTLEKWRGSGYAALRPLAGLDGMNTRKLRGMVKDMGISNLADLKKSMDNGTFDAYTNLESQLKQIIREYIITNHG